MKTIKFAKENKDIFEAILSGKKKIETRAGSEMYQDVKVGDKLVLICEDKKAIKTIKKVEHFKSISALLKKYKPSDINPSLKTKAQTEDLYYSFPNYKEKIKKYGIIAWRLE